MALSTPPFIPQPWAEDGEKVDIPVSTHEQGRASWEAGFPPETAIPQASGGIPPNRLDFQGAFNSFSRHIFYQQSGSLYAWNNSLDYVKGAHVLGSDGNEYICVKENGVSGTVQNPVTDSRNTYWKQQVFLFLDRVYPVGSIYLSMNGTNPSSLFGGTWKQLGGRFLLGGDNTYVAGNTGGETKHAITAAEMPIHKHTVTAAEVDNHTHTTTVNTVANHTHTITVAEGGAHAHTGSSNTTGNHTHGIGITGAGTHQHTATTSDAGYHSHSGSTAGNGSHYHGSMGEHSSLGSLYGYYDGANNHLGYKGSFDTDNTIWRTSTDGWHAHAIVGDGSHTHTLATTWASDHTHGTSCTTVGDHSHTITIASGGAHSHSASSAAAGGHTHTVTNAAAGKHTHTMTVGNAGSGSAMSLMPPYLVCYMWQRTA